MKQNGTFGRDITTLDSSRTSKNNSVRVQGGNHLLKSIDVVGRTNLLSNEARELSLKMLNRGGKRIDLEHSQKKTIVGAHMINENSQDPTNLEKETLNSNKVPSTKLTNNVQASNVQLYHMKRSSSDQKWISHYDRSKTTD